MKHRNFIYWIIAFALISSCNSGSKKFESENLSLFPGSWKLVFYAQGENIPIKAKVQDTNFIIINGSEQIPLSYKIVKDSIFISIPNFNSHIEGHVLADTTFTGIYVKNNVDDYIIPVKGRYTFEDRFVLKSKNSDFLKPKYEVFIDRGNRITKAIGLFEQAGPSVVGSFATETGDYRFLEGNVDGNKLHLSTFDGSHLFLFTAEIKGDSLVNGKFISGKTGNYNWYAVANQGFELHDPENLTKLNKAIKPDLSLKFITTDGDSVSLLDDRFKGKVKILQIMGTWCPNCLDETRYFNGIYKKYHDKGLEIIAFAFENGTNTKVILDKIKKYKKTNEVKYIMAYGGKASSKIAHSVFPYLDKVMSFPTTLYFDRNNRIRKIYTGFYGPGTGVYYENFVSKNNAFIEQLLNE